MGEIIFSVKLHHVMHADDLEHILGLSWRIVYNDGIRNVIHP